MTTTQGSTALWRFCLRSLITEYGLGFIIQVALVHPLATWRGLRRYKRDYRYRVLETFTSRSAHGEFRWKGGPRSIVGVGFCLKPREPVCPSGRANHDCWFLEQLSIDDDACADCVVRRLGSAALRAGCAFYVMTSAQDILRDLLLPALHRGEYTHALLVLCRYSVEPFRLALSICGVESRMVAFEKGDCRDFASWRMADKGVKSEQTSLAAPTLDGMLDMLADTARELTGKRRFRKNGHVFISEHP